MAQQPDTRPGNYYVSVIDGRRVALLLGPFVNDHAGALAKVDAVRKVAEDMDPRAFWYSYGTVRLHDGEPAPPGKLNSHPSLV